MGDDITSTVTTEVLGFTISFALGFAISQLWNQFIRFRYRNWKAELFFDGKTIISRPISPRKMSQIMEEPYEKAVYVKGVISPYGQLRCDPLETEGLISINEQNKQLTIDLDRDKNFHPYDALTDLENEPINL